MELDPRELRALQRSLADLAGLRLRVRLQDLPLAGLPDMLRGSGEPELAAACELLVTALRAVHDQLGPSGCIPPTVGTAGHLL